MNEGVITTEQSLAVEQRFEELDGSTSKNSIYAEIAAYLGGAFVLISTLFIAGKFWSDAPRALQSAVAALVSIVLLTIAHFLGAVNAMRLRLTSVLSLGGAIAATGAAAFAAATHGAPWFPFLTGCIVNLLLGFHVWDYSDLPLNILGQICIPFSIIWFFISGIGIVMDDYIRYIFFKEEKPKYFLLISKERN